MWRSKHSEQVKMQFSWIEAHKRIFEEVCKVIDQEIIIKNTFRANLNYRNENLNQIWKHV